MTEAPRWQRHGLAVRVKPGHPWWRSHAQLPTVLPLSERLWRVYFAARDGDNRSRILAADLDPADNMRVVAEHFEPLLDLGPMGAFDHEGVGPGSAIVIDGEIRLYYGGLIVRRDVRGQTTIGLALSRDGLAFRRAFEGPVLGIGPLDPLFTSAPTVLRTPDGFRMWYVGGTQWRQVNDEFDVLCEIRTARSADGLFWDPRSETAATPDTATGATEAALGRPWIVQTGAGLRLFACRRGKNYRAQTEDAYRLVWFAMDATARVAGPMQPLRFANPPAAGDFDGQMQAYPSVAAYGDDLIMFYNGDAFGRDGLGWARLPGGARRNGASA